MRWEGVKHFKCKPNWPTGGKGGGGDVYWNGGVYLSDYGEKKTWLPDKPKEYSLCSVNVLYIHH